MSTGTNSKNASRQGDLMLWVAGGVIAECESISLSRDAPALVRYVAEPLIESTARESMDRTLTSFRARFAAKARS